MIPSRGFLLSTAACQAHFGCRISEEDHQEEFMKRWVPQERNPAERGAYSFDFRTSEEERQLELWPRKRKAWLPATGIAFIVLLLLFVWLVR